MKSIAEIVLQNKMRRWTDAKLQKELAFAQPADDGSPECAMWNNALAAEAKRRGITANE